MYQKAVDAAPTHGFALYNYAILKEVQISYYLTTKCTNVLGPDFSFVHYVVIRTYYILYIMQ
jgi:hypothetical protein